MATTLSLSMKVLAPSRVSLPRPCRARPLRAAARPRASLLLDVQTWAPLAGHALGAYLLIYTSLNWYTYRSARLRREESEKDKK